MALASPRTSAHVIPFPGAAAPTVKPAPGLRCKRGDLAMYVGTYADGGHPVHNALKGKVVSLTRNFWCPLRSKWMWEFGGPYIPVPGGEVDALADASLLPILPGAMLRQGKKKKAATRLAASPVEVRHD